MRAWEAKIHADQIDKAGEIHSEFLESTIVPDEAQARAWVEERLAQPGLQSPWGAITAVRLVDESFEDDDYGLVPDTSWEEITEGGEPITYDAELTTDGTIRWTREE